MSEFDTEYILSKYFGYTEEQFLDETIERAKRLCRAHLWEKHNDRVAFWNMMHGNPPEEPDIECSPEIAEKMSDDEAAEIWEMTERKVKERDGLRPNGG